MGDDGAPVRLLRRPARPSQPERAAVLRSDAETVETDRQAGHPPVENNRPLPAPPQAAPPTVGDRGCWLCELVMQSYPATD
jgi:hypothetical protein